MVKLNLSRHEKEALTYLFETIDEDRDSLITLAEIAKTFKDKFNMQISDEIYDKIEKQLCRKGSPQVTYTEFLMASCTKSVLLSEV